MKAGNCPNKFALHECEICDKEFITYDLFETHMLDTHNFNYSDFIQSSCNNEFNRQEIQEIVGDIYNIPDSDVKPEHTNLSKVIDLDLLNERMIDEDEEILKTVFKPSDNTLLSNDNDSNWSDESEINVNIVRGGDILNKVNIKSCGFSSQIAKTDFYKKMKKISKKRKENKRNLDQENLKKLEKRKIEEEYLKIMNSEESINNIVEQKLQEELRMLDDMDDELETITNYEDENIEDWLSADCREQISNIVDEYLINKDNNEHSIELLYNNASEPLSYVVKIDNSTLPASYECHFCGTFETQIYDDFILHIKNHLNSIPRKKQMQRRETCPICNMTFPTHSILEHLKLHLTHDRCSYCHKMVLLSELPDHVATHSKSHKCNVCGELYNSIVAVRKHGSHHKKGVSYYCSQCNRQFAGLEKLVRHVSFEHYTIDPEYCECPFCLELTSDIKNHIYSTGRCKFKCVTCLKVEPTEKEYISHMKNHFEGQVQRPITQIALSVIFNCQYCHFVHTDKSLYNDHVRVHKLFNSYCQKVTKKKKTVTCDICNMLMPATYLDYHRRNHKFNELCLQCGKYICKSNIVEHQQNHQNDYLCEICNLVFDNKRKWENHRWCHGRKLSRPCGHKLNDGSVCELKFASELTRQTHISLIHLHIEPQFRLCYFCDELVSHKDISSHLFDNPACKYRCKLCGNRHSNANSYQKHIEQSHSITLV